MVKKEKNKMNRSAIRITLPVIVLLLSILACGVSASTANIQSARMARDSEGNEPTDVFAPEETFYCIVDLANAPDDTTVKAAWTAVAVEGAEPDTFIDETELTTGSGNLHFELTNDGPWPAGTYKVDLYLNDELKQTLEFQVQ
jgi:hypothetical protein